MVSFLCWLSPLKTNFGSRPYEYVKVFRILASSLEGNYIVVYIFSMLSSYDFFVQQSGTILESLVEGMNLASSLGGEYVF